MPSQTTHFGYETIPTQEKTQRIHEVFQSVADRYDLMNDLMSFGLHRLWKRMAVARCNIAPHHQVLDLAGGTGDLTALFAKRLNNEGRVFLSDINAAMLDIGKKRLADKGIVKPVEFVLANAESLPFLNESFDVVAIAFGLRNVTHKEIALHEIFRVLKPNGRLVILEFSHPTSKPLNTVYDAYSFSVLPCLGKLLCNDSESYRYLAESIRVHPNQETLKTMMETAGLSQVSYQNMNGGIVALHLGFKR